MKAQILQKIRCISVLSNTVDMAIIANVSGGNVAGIIGTQSNHVVRFRVNGTDAMTLSTSGRLGINVTSQNGYLDVYGEGDTGSSVTIRNGNADGNFVGNQIVLSFAGSLNYAHAIKTRHQSGGAAGNAIDIYTWKHGDAAATQAGQYVMTIQGNGCVGIGKTNPVYNIDVVGTGYFTSTLNANSFVKTGGTSIQFLKADGSVDGNTYLTVSSAQVFYVPYTGANANLNMGSFTITAGAFFETSDATIKTLITDDYTIEGIENIASKLYIKDGRQEVGYFAQDVLPLLPNAVAKNDAGILSLSYKEVHTAKIARLEKRVKELESKLGI